MKKCIVCFLVTTSLCANMAPEVLEPFRKNSFVEAETFDGQGVRDGECPSTLMVERRQNLDKHEKVFTEIYDKAIWGRNDQGVGFSGEGSLLLNTREYISFLEKFIKEYGITSVVDAGCGDWEFSRYVDWTGINYSGYDIVTQVIEKNKILFSSPTINFARANITTVDFPKADLLLCKEVLQHLPNEDILKFLQQIEKFKYCLITNEVDPKTLSSKNSDILIGRVHRVDLSCPPFNIEGKKVLNYTIGRGVHQVFLIDNTID